MPDNWAAGVNPGQVVDYTAANPPPPPLSESTLVSAFDAQDLTAADVVVLRGYLGRSDIVKRARKYLTRARNDAITKLKDAGLAAGWSTYQVKQVADAMEDQAAGANEFAAAAAAAAVSQAKRGPVEADPVFADVVTLNSLLRSLTDIADQAKEHIPWRLYLSPRLDRYVDFHVSSLIAWRQEPGTENRDACTVWLRAFEIGSQMPIPYRLIQETTVAPSFAAWLNGQFVDDYAGDNASGGAWGTQAAFGTGKFCSTGTGKHCYD